MEYPVDNFLTNWNITAGYKYGDKTDYGFHEADDLNMNGGGNIDLGQNCKAVADGEITSVHSHTGSPTFGNHLHLKFNIDGKDYWAHYAHCQTILVTEGQKVKKGDIIATVGNSGTTFAHLHFAIKNQPTGVDGIAKTQEDLKKWENPTEFIRRHLVETPMATITQKELDEIRIARDENDVKFKTQLEVSNALTEKLKQEQEYSKTLLEQLEKESQDDLDLTAQLLDAQKALTPLQNEISEAKKVLGINDTADLITAIKGLKATKVKTIKQPKPEGFIEKLLFLFS